MNKKNWIAIFSVVVLFGAMAFAGDDPSIKGNLRTGIQASMNEFINEKTVGKAFRIYDPVDGKLLTLKLKDLHEGIVKKGDFYVSCADFVSPHGKKYDLDFLVILDGKALKTIQAIVHSVNGKKRKYHLETK